MAFAFGDVVNHDGIPAMVLFRYGGDDRCEITDFEITAPDETEPILALCNGDYIVMNLAEDPRYRRPVGWVTIETNPTPYPNKEV